jgi:uncharacterized membrane protein YhiD involved in acid resistance
MNLPDIGIRLLVATVIGCLIGLNRFAHHRFIGVRTLGLVSLVNCFWFSPEFSGDKLLGEVGGPFDRSGWCKQRGDI